MIKLINHLGLEQETELKKMMNHEESMILRMLNLKRQL